MPYDYKAVRSNLFTDDGQRLFLQIRDNTKRLIAESGAAMAENCWKGCTGSTWNFMACLDRMVELGELREISPEECAGQHRVFIKS